ncbi:hypothetical protein [Sodalis sp. C49]|uniref:hypothetical protein n=1 Tax=unclassified Sodalis (in: enterobacteria) TaxID=2636512 RepID=UPI003965D125
MHTLIIVVVGLALLGLFTYSAHFVGRPAIATAVKAFMVLWLVISLANLGVGVFRAGYTLLEELPVLALVFGVPAIAALLVHKRLNNKK